MKRKSDWFIRLMVLAIFGSVSYAVLTATYAHSQIEPPEMPCFGQFGHPMPVSFCDSRENRIINLQGTHEQGQGWPAFDGDRQ